MISKFCGYLLTKAEIISDVRNVKLHENWEKNAWNLDKTCQKIFQLGAFKMEFFFRDKNANYRTFSITNNSQ